MADPITLHIYVMGLAMLVSGDNGKDLAVLLPKPVDHSHYAVLVYPCNDPTCRGQAMQVHDDLELSGNLKGELLYFEPETFGAVELGGRKVYFNPPPRVDSAGSSARAKRPRHSSYTRWWFHMMGEVPSSADVASDIAWGVSLSEIVSCAPRTPGDGDGMFNDNGLAGFLHIKALKTIPVSVASEASTQEYETGMCNNDGSLPSVYVPTISFGPEYWPFASPNQATADIVVIEMKLDSAPQITLQTSLGQQTSITPYVDNDHSKPLNILIGNLSPLQQKKPAVCKLSGHFMLYNQLLDPNPNCQLKREPQLGGVKTTRVKKEALGQRDADLPGVIKVVSLESGEHYDLVPLAGLARPICFLATN